MSINNSIYNFQSTLKTKNKINARQKPKHVSHFNNCTNFDVTFFKFLRYQRTTVQSPIRIIFCLLQYLLLHFYLHSITHFVKKKANKHCSGTTYSKFSSSVKNASQELSQMEVIRIFILFLPPSLIIIIIRLFFFFFFLFVTLSYLHL